jgi:cytochrome c biogenesis protein CcdA
MKLNDNTNVQMPLKTVASLITLVAVGTWAYFGVIARLTQVETSLVLTEKDLTAANEFIIGVPKGDMVSPQINELFMLVEFISATQEKLQSELELMMSNTVNINFLKDQVLKLQTDVEKLKDKVRENKNGH